MFRIVKLILIVCVVALLVGCISLPEQKLITERILKEPLLFKDLRDISMASQAHCYQEDCIYGFDCSDCDYTAKATAYTDVFKPILTDDLHDSSEKFVCSIGIQNSGCNYCARGINCNSTWKNDKYANYSFETYAKTSVSRMYGQDSGIKYLVVKGNINPERGLNYSFFTPQGAKIIQQSSIYPWRFEQEINTSFGSVFLFNNCLVYIVKYVPSVWVSARYHSELNTAMSACFPKKRSNSEDRQEIEKELAEEIEKMSEGIVLVNPDQKKIEKQINITRRYCEKKFEGFFNERNYGGKFPASLLGCHHKIDSELLKLKEKQFNIPSTEFESAKKNEEKDKK